MKLKFNVTGMTCAACSARVEKVTNAVPGVEKAEVMYSAPPQYHVRGAAINLVLKGYKPGEGGLQGEVNGEYKQQKEAGGNGGVTLAYTSPKIDLDFMYNLQSNYTRGYIDFIARHTVKEQESGDGQ